MKLNKTRVGILSLCGVLALAGFGGALAYVITETQESGTVTTESAIYLDWGSTQNVVNVTNLNATEPQYREVVVEYAKSTSASGTPKVTFALDAETTEGIKVEVSKNVDWGTINLNPSQYEESILTLSSSSTQVVYDIDASSTTYYLKFSYSAANTLSANEISGNLTISLSLE